MLAQGDGAGTVREYCDYGAGDSIDAVCHGCGTSTRRILEIATPMPIHLCRQCYHVVRTACRMVEAEGGWQEGDMGSGPLGGDAT